MRKTLYPQLAVNGIRKNKRLYLPYILTCGGMVMMFYIISFLANGEALDAFIGGNVMQQTLTFGYIVIAVFSLIFLFYTNSFLIRRRKKEFGLYNILGMGKWNLARVLVWESLISSAVSIISGLFFGILFSKFAELAMIYILQAETDFTLRIEWHSIGQTILVFSVIFVLLLINTLRQIRTAKPIELLRSENAGEKPPKANWLFALAGIIILIIAYIIAVAIKSPMEALLMFFVAVVMVIIATYLLFISGSVAFCKLLQKKKSYYYKTNHFVSVSSMVYRMKRNGAGLASICILCTMVLVMVSSTVCLYAGAENSLRKRYPRNINLDIAISEISEFDSEQSKQAEAAAFQIAQEHNQTPKNISSYHYADFLAYIDGNKATTSNLQSYSDSNIIFIIPLRDYNSITNKNEVLAEDEALIYTTKNFKYKHEDIIFENGNRFRIKEAVPEFIPISEDVMNVLPSVFLVVNDFEQAVEPMMRLADFKGNRLVTLKQYYGFDLDCDDEKQIEISDSISEKLNSLMDTNEGLSVRWSSSAREKQDFYGLYGSLFFLGVLLGIVFVFAAVLIIYYKQISEGYEDQSRFEIMQKVGMTKKEIRKSINSQVLTVFFIPLIMSAIHLGFAFPMIYKMLLLFGITDLAFLIAVTLACFAVFTAFYIIVYKITSKAYYSIVSEAK